MTACTAIHEPSAKDRAARRFAICKTCEHSRDDAFACALYHACCFGRWRARPESQCPDNPRKWEAGHP